MTGALRKKNQFFSPKAITVTPPSRHLPAREPACTHTCVHHTLSYSTHPSSFRGTHAVLDFASFPEQDILVNLCPDRDLPRARTPQNFLCSPELPTMARPSANVRRMEYLIESGPRQGIPASHPFCTFASFCQVSISERFAELHGA